MLKNGIEGDQFDMMESEQESELKIDYLKHKIHQMAEVHVREMEEARIR